MEVIIDPLDIAPPRVALLMKRWINLAAMVDDPVTRIAILGVSSTTGRAEAELHNASGPPTRSVLRFRDGFTPLDFEAMEDMDGDSFSEVAVLLSRHSDARMRADIKNIAGMNVCDHAHIWLS